MGVRAFVMARKGVLINHPDVQRMSTAQWLFEYHSLIKAEHHRFETFFKVFKGMMVGLLGLNAIKPEDEKGQVKRIEDMTVDEKESFLPLVHWIGRPEMMKIVGEQIEQGLEPMSSPDKNYEALVAAIDAAEGDAEPIIEQLHNVDLAKIPKNPRADQQAKQLGILDIKDSKIEMD